MKEIEVEGFKVTIERSEGKFIVSVPKLPGCTTQVDREEDAAHEIRRIIGVYLAGLSNSFTPLKRGQLLKLRARKDSEPPPKIRK
ncbi:MAG: type II toxin-antitoxin system HicB family antitoxin [Candidatus Micrarchaeota archaeon]